MTHHYIILNRNTISYHFDITLNIGFYDWKVRLIAYVLRNKVRY